MVAEVDGLGALQVRVARHRPVEMPLGDLDQRLGELERAARRRSASRRARTSRRRSRPDRCANGRCEACRRPAGELGHAPLDRHVDVLVALGKWEAAVAQLAARPPRRDAAASRSASLMIPRAASIDACAIDCSTSSGPRRRSNESESFSARKASCCGSEKRDIVAGDRPRVPQLRRRSTASAPPHPRDLSLGHLREERERDRARRDVLADRELALAMTERLAVVASSGGSPGSRACSAPRARASARTTPSRSTPRGSCTTNTNQPRAGAARVRAGQRQILDRGAAPRGRAPPRARGRPASRRAARAGRSRARRRCRTAGS